MVKSGAFYKKGGPYFSVESNSPSVCVNFGELQARLIRAVNRRIQNGHFTERGLARILGISQSHMHNVLKGARKLRPEIADRLIFKLELSLLELFETAELSAQLKLRTELNGGYGGGPIEGDGWSAAMRRNSGAEGKRKPPQRETQTDPLYEEFAV